VENEMVESICNIGFWEEYIRTKFIRQIELFHDAVEGRLLPTFDSIEKEAEEHSQNEWDRLCSSCSSPDIDPGDLAETAEEAGIDYYMMLSDIKQTVLNVTAIAFYHLFEQQVIFFLRREILHPARENEPQLMKVTVFRDLLLSKGVDVAAFAAWGKIEELKVVSNAIKHGEGASATVLRQIRPDMFKHPLVRRPPEREIMDSGYHRVYMPMGGDDIFVIQGDLFEYKNALVSFWNELILACSHSIQNTDT
jgi:hypothetical protein